MPRVSVKIPLEELQPQSVQAHEPPTPQPMPEPPSEQPAATTKSTGKRFDKKYLIYAGGLLIVILLVFLLLNDRRHLKQEVNKLSTATSNTNNSQADATKYIDAASKLVEVPSKTAPLVNTPSDEEITKLKAVNPIYVNIQPKDVFLIYTLPDKSLFLVVYRPSINKIISAIAADQSSSAPSQSTSGTTPQTPPTTKTTKP